LSILLAYWCHQVREHSVVTTKEAADMVPTFGSVAETSTASDVVYVDGPLLAIFVFIFIFLFVAMTDNSLAAGCGLFVVLVSALFAFLSWRSLADYPLTYRDGDPPSSEPQGADISDIWKLHSGANMSATMGVDHASGVETLAGDLALEYGCSAARIDWRIQVGENLLASGTFREGQKRELTDVAVRSTHLPIMVKLTATRLDSAGCETKLAWHNPGLEGPGNGRFRFVLPLPDVN
jgi:hypothetical protein